MTTNVDRKAHELRNDVLGAVERFTRRRPDVEWGRILEGVLEAAAVVEAAAEVGQEGQEGRSKARALVEALKG